jgi:hypothetical protein
MTSEIQAGAILSRKKRKKRTIQSAKKTEEETLPHLNLSGVELESYEPKPLTTRAQKIRQLVTQKTPTQFVRQIQPQMVRQPIPPPALARNVRQLVTQKTPTQFVRQIQPQMVRQPVPPPTLARNVRQLVTQKTPTQFVRQIQPQIAQPQMVRQPVPPPALARNVRQLVTQKTPRPLVRQIPPRTAVEVIEEEQPPRFPRRAPLEVIEEPRQRPLELIERTRDVETVLPVPEYSEVIQEPVILPIVKPEERSSILRRAFSRSVVEENDQDYSPAVAYRRRFAPKRRFAPVTEQVQEQRQVTETVDTFDPHYTSYVDAQATQTVAVAPVDNIPVLPTPSSPNAFIFNNSPSNDVEIAPYTKLVIKSQPRPTISVSSITASYLSNLLESTPRIRVSSNVERPYRQQSSVHNYY